MEYAEAIKELEPLLGELFSQGGIHDMNWKVDNQPGHPFTIGPEHIAHANDHHGGLLGLQTTEAIGCAHQSSRLTGKCKRPYSSHQHDTVLFLKLKGHAIEQRVKEILSNAKVLDIMAQAKLDGFAFVETPEKFRIHKEVLPS